MPRSLGGKGGATNPEQMFAGGYAACFENALLRVGRQAGQRFGDNDVEVVAEVGLTRNEADAFVLSVALTITMAGVEQAKAEFPGSGRRRHLPLLQCDPGQYRRRENRRGALTVLHTDMGGRRHIRRGARPVARDSEIALQTAAAGAAYIPRRARTAAGIVLYGDGCHP